MTNNKFYAGSVFFMVVALFIVGCRGSMTGQITASPKNILTAPFEDSTPPLEDVSADNTPTVEQETASEQEELVAPETSAVEDTPVLNVSAPKFDTYTVNLIKDGFEIDKLTIKVGDKVIWQNVREGRIIKALVFGTQKCAQLKSPMFYPGQVYSWTFDKAGSCMVVDGIFTTQAMKITVEDAKI